MLQYDFSENVWPTVEKSVIMPVEYDKRFGAVLVKWESRKEVTNGKIEKRHTMRKFD